MFVALNLLGRIGQIRGYYRTQVAQAPLSRRFTSPKRPSPSHNNTHQHTPTRFFWLIIGPAAMIESDRLLVIGLSAAWGR